MQSRSPTPSPVKYKCARSGCKLPAVCSFAIRIPAVGVSVQQHIPLKMIVPLPVCKAHSDDVVAADFIDDRMKQSAAIFCSMHNKQTPDFKRAFLERIPLTDQMFIKAVTPMNKAANDAKTETAAADAVEQPAAAT